MIKKILLLVLVAAGLLWWFFGRQKGATPTYQTAIASKGTLVSTVTAAGNVTSANNVILTVQVAGTVKDVLVKNGDTVSAGQTIARLVLDQASQQKAAGAYASYLAAQNSLAAANAKLNSLQSTLFKTNQAFVTDRGVSNPSNDQKADPKYIEENADWLQAEADYKNQQLAISAAQASLTSASLNLSQTSATITAPVAGTVKGLTITPGAIISLTSTSSNTSTSQVLGSIYQTGPILAQVNISEIDSVKVSQGQKVTLTLDAFPGKTFTGKIIGVNTNGVISSSVISYPAIIAFDTSVDHIYPNMGVNAKIITSVKDNVVLVPSAAVRSGVVRVMKNNQPESVNVEVGDANDTQTEITSGVNDGDQVVTSSVNSGNRSSTQTTSVFGGGGFRGFGGGGGR